MERTGHVYIMGSESGSLYVGVTSNLHRRVWEHKLELVPGFTARYHCHKLLYFEEFARIDDAIATEKLIKAWSRKKKIALIQSANPRFNDLAWNWYDSLT